MVCISQNNDILVSKGTPAGLEPEDTYVSGLFQGWLTITCLLNDSLDVGAASIGSGFIACCFEMFLRENGFLLDAGLVNENSETPIKELGGRSSNGVLSEASMIQDYQSLMAVKGRKRRCAGLGRGGVVFPIWKVRAAVSTFNVLWLLHTARRTFLFL